MGVRKSSLVGRAAAWSARHRKAAILGWLAFVVAAVFIGSAVGQNNMTAAEEYPGESGRAQTALEEGRLQPNTEMVLVTARDGRDVSAPAVQSAIRDLSANLEKTQYVREVRSPLEKEAPISADGKAALLEYEISGSVEQAEDRVGPSQETVRAATEAHPELKLETFGNASANVALTEMINEDLHHAEALSLPVTGIILMVAFGSLVAAGLPLILAFSAVIATMSLVAIPSQIFPVNDNVASIILLVGLAVGVDYSLFYLRREREERRAGRDNKTALAIAAETSGHAVLVSGLTVIAAMAGMYLTGGAMLTSLASGSVLVVAVAMVASISVLPAMMAWLGDRVDRGRLPRLHRRPRRPMAASGGFWGAVVRRVMRRPLLWTLVAGGALIGLSLPVLGMNTQVTAITDLPRDVPEMIAYDHVQEKFPGETANASVVIEADDVRSGAVVEQTGALLARTEQSDHFLPGARTTYSEDGTKALVELPIAGTGSDEASIDAVSYLRDDIIPATVGSVGGAEVNVTGEAARSIDEDVALSSSLPIVFAFVLGLTFLLMLITFKSVVIPIGTIVLNLLSVGAAYGVLVLVFQHGLGESVLGFESNGGITSWLPLFLFVILFGLSMDYHVFILSRVRELYKQGRSTDEAISEGISATAGTVTSAALVMVGVFATFATLSFIDMKQMGVGLAVAVLIDATIIRGVLLPAGMKLLGDRTWWMPRRLDWSRPAADSA